MTPVPAEPRPRRRLGAPLLMVLVMWIVAFADAGTPTKLVQYGIRPRSEDGLVGIVAAPFLHADFAHLIANTGAFIVLGMLVAAVSRRYWPVTVGVALISGVAVWLIAAPNTIHIGASGLVYGYAAFLVAWGLVTRRASSILVAVLVVLLYGGLVFGVLPTQQGISWQGHLFGAIGGVVMALVL
ncbi:MAG TPA: rhomboid family intramembrane serine protease, partial [Jiangellaceae bacterium]|nr:rhomboid family intramembrane serine protease [Jiangellaceae bacterium]